MIGGIVEIAEDNRRLSVSRGFLVVSDVDGTQLGKVPLDDITGLILSARQCSLSRNIMVELAERKAVAVICGDSYHPVSLLWPFDAHHRGAAILRLQIDATLPLQKRLWQQIVKAKIQAQMNALDDDLVVANIRPLMGQVKSGDSDNREAQAARLYWPAMMQKDFRRDRFQGGINSLLNYGYAILRAATARAVCGAGLHPALGLHHKTDVNAFALVDDLMEPFRPLVDLYVKDLIEVGAEAVTPESKRKLVSILQHDLLSDRGVSPLINCLSRMAQSLVRCLETGQVDLEIAEVKPSSQLL